jgi:hypothetical protein
MLSPGPDTTQRDGLRRARCYYYYVGAPLEEAEPWRRWFKRKSCHEKKSSPRKEKPILSQQSNAGDAPRCSWALTLLEKSLKYYKPNIYAYGIVGIAAAAYIIRSFLLGPHWIAPVVEMLVLMVPVLMFSVLARSTNSQGVKLASQVFLWTIVALPVIAWVYALTGYPSTVGSILSRLQYVPPVVFETDVDNGATVNGFDAEGNTVIGGEGYDFNVTHGATINGLKLKNSRVLNPAPTAEPQAQHVPPEPGLDH